MKKLFVVAAATGLLWSCGQKAEKKGTEQETPEKNTVARVSAEIKGLEDTNIVLSYKLDDEHKADTIATKGGKFTWEGNMPEPQKVYVMFPNQYVQFFVESGDINITGVADSLQQLKITGSKVQDEAIAYYNSLEDLTSQEYELYSQYGKGTDEEQQALEAKLTDLRGQKRERLEAYLKANPKSIFSLNLLADRAMIGHYEDIKPLYELLDASVLNSNAGKDITERLDVLKRSAIGTKILDFTQNDVDGKPVSYADYAGKYVFIDFWASWCGPCRAENPNVLKAYNTYKDKNFTILGVSLDDDEAKWKKAIAEDGLPWTQVSDLKGFKNEISSYYGIQGIPSTLLIDPEGKIIAKDLRGQELHQKLEEIL
ncbi:redoxin domain-containing protein [Sinomicrobium sp.]